MLNGYEVIPLNCIWDEPNHLIHRIRELKERDNDRNWTYTKQELQLKNVYHSLPPAGGAHLPRFAVWQPANMSFGSAMVPNKTDGLIQLMRHLNRSYTTRYMAVVLSRNHKGYGYCGFEHVDLLGEKRVVYVIKDPRWKFFQQGPILPFENPAYYEQKRISDRLTPDIVMDYLKALGWDLRDQAFWQSRGDSWFAHQTAFN